MSPKFIGGILADYLLGVILFLGINLIFHINIFMMVRISMQQLLKFME
jgi:hypothetical protein